MWPDESLNQVYEVMKKIDCEYRSLVRSSDRGSVVDARLILVWKNTYVL